MFVVRLYTCEADLEKAMSGQEGYRHDLRDKECQLHKLASDLHHVSSERKELALVLGQAQQSQDKIDREHQLRLNSLRVRYWRSYQAIWNEQHE